MPRVKSAYVLELADGQKWQLVSTRETDPFVKMFAVILGIKKSRLNGYPKILFVNRAVLSSHRLKGFFPGTGWYERDLTCMKMYHNRFSPDVVCEITAAKSSDQDVIRMYNSLIPVYERTQALGGFAFHGALIRRKNSAILIAAAGGRGKTTCCRRIRSPWRPVCDDLTLIVKDRAGKYYCQPLPTWTNYIRDFKKDPLWLPAPRWPMRLALRAIFFLVQDTVDKAIPVGNGAAAVMINESGTQAHQWMWRSVKCDAGHACKRILFDNACSVAKTIPAFILKAKLHGAFWNEIERVIDNGA